MAKIDVAFRRFAIWMLSAFLLICPHGLVFADASSASLSVTVTDTSGAVIPNAHLVVRNSATSQQQQSESGKSGAATFPFLKPGRYQLTVSKDAFSDVVVDNVVLNVGDERRLELVLKVGSAAQTVTVDGSGLSLNTTDASVGTVIDRKFVENIPLNGRSFQDLIAMTPGVVTQSPQSSSQFAGFGGNFSINGQRTESNYYMIDGVAANTNAGYATGYAQSATGGTIGAATALGTTQSLMSVDALQEFRVQSSTYSAECGRSPGGQLSFATRSGTDDLHGTVFDYLRNDFFDANDWFNDHYGKRITALRQNDFGGTLGGRIRIPRLYDGKDRSFFFISYEGLRLTQPQPATVQYVPDSFMRRQAAATVQPILNAFPIQNGLDYGSSASPNVAQFIQAYSLPSRIDSTSARVDHNLSPKLSVFFRFGYTPSEAKGRTLSAVSTRSSSTSSFTLGATSPLSSWFSNEFRLGYTQSNSTLAQSLDSFGGSTPVDLAQTLGIGGSANGFPDFYLLVSGVGSTGLYTETAQNKSRQWNVVDTANWLVGRQQIRMGIDYRRIISPLRPSSPYVYAAFISPQSVIVNAPFYFAIQKFIPATPVFNEFAAFVQDDWKIASRLSLSFGLRWEVDPPPTDIHGNDAYTLSGSLGSPASLSLAPQGTPLWKTPWYNFAPRIGTAWTASTRPGWETVIRTGGGVFFDTNNQVGTKGFTGIGFQGVNTISGSSIPVTSAQLNFVPSASAPYASSVVYAFPQHLQLPYTLQWNASLQQALGRSQTITISYVGSNGRRLQGEQQLSLHSLNPNFGTVVYFPSGVTSNYQALQIGFQRSVSHGLQALASYTWSHSIDFGSTASALPLIRGNSDFDVRNNFQGGLSWELPSPKTNTYVRNVFGGWATDARIMARTAFPVSLQGAARTDPVSGSLYYTNVNIVAGQTLYLYGSQYPGGRAVNKAAFAVPTGTDPGNAPRNFIRGFDATQLNFAVRREFHFTKETTLQFRAETFNLLNHPNFGFVDPVLTDATFGQATLMLNSSLGTVASQYQQGGPRSMQFALKVMF